MTIYLGAMLALAVGILVDDATVEIRKYQSQLWPWERETVQAILDAALSK